MPLNLLATLRQNNKYGLFRDRKERGVCHRHDESR